MARRSNGKPAAKAKRQIPRAELDVLLEQVKINALKSQADIAVALWQGVCNKRTRSYIHTIRCDHARKLRTSTFTHRLRCYYHPRWSENQQHDNIENVRVLFDLYLDLGADLYTAIRTATPSALQYSLLQDLNAKLDEAAQYITAVIVLNMQWIGQPYTLLSLSYEQLADLNLKKTLPYTNEGRVDFAYYWGVFCERAYQNAPFQPPSPIQIVKIDDKPRFT